MWFVSSNVDKKDSIWCTAARDVVNASCITYERVSLVINTQARFLTSKGGRRDWRSYSSVGRAQC